MISCRARLVTMDETWLYHYDLETKQQSMEWWHSGSPRSKIFQVQKSAVKVLASIFWDREGILLIDYLPKGQTINVEYYSSLMVQLKDILKEKRRGKVTKGVLFVHDNAAAHLALATQKNELPPGPWTEKTIERLAFFIQHRGHCCRGDLVGRTAICFFLIFFI
jgi:hypothetical protein